MWGFVDLRGLSADLPRNQQLNFGGVANLSPSIYAIDESTELSRSLHGDVNCDIFVHLHTDVGARTDGFVSKLKFYLADVEADNGTISSVIQTTNGSRVPSSRPRTDVRPSGKDTKSNAEHKVERKR